MLASESKSALAQPAAVGISGRVASIDVFRGLTMAVMIFVNDLAGVKGLPWWTYHAHKEQDVMTYVDMVFPIFLFVLGMSMPLAIKQRLKRDPSKLRLCLHILLRTASLLVLGLILANARGGDPARMGIGRHAWSLLSLVGAMLFLNVYPPSERHRTLFRALKFGGLALVAAMFIIFRRTMPDGQAAWLNISYWEILGLIGWTYLAVSILYLSTRKWKAAPVIWFILLLAFNVLTVGKWLPFPGHLPFYLWPFGNGAFALMSMGGIVTSTIFLDGDAGRSFARRAIPACLFAAITLLTAWLLTPFGISKIRATPTWCLYSVGASVLIFTALYWICDVKKQTAWSFFVRPAGANTLTTYLLPDLYAYAIGSLAAAQFRVGGLGVVKSLVFTAFILALSALLTKCKIRMQL
jgi:heparan-alpha-glucosaminide N-acetyltransferase